MDFPQYPQLRGWPVYNLRFRAIITYTTLGLADIRPANPADEIIASSEVILDYTTLELCLPSSRRASLGTVELGAGFAPKPFHRSAREALVLDKNPFVATEIDIVGVFYDFI